MLSLTGLSAIDHTNRQISDPSNLSQVDEGHSVSTSNAAETAKFKPWSKLTAGICGAKEMRLISSDGVLVHALIRQWMNDKKGGVCWASNPTIAKKLGMGEKTVRRRIQDLEELGFVYREPRQGTTDLLRALDEPGEWKDQWGPTPTKIANTGIVWREKVAAFDVANKPSEDKSSNKDSIVTVDTTPVSVTRGSGQRDQGVRSERPTISISNKDLSNKTMASAAASADVEVPGGGEKQTNSVDALVAKMLFIEAVEVKDGHTLKVTPSDMRALAKLLREGPKELAGVNPVSLEEFTEVMAFVKSGHCKHRLGSLAMAYGKWLSLLDGKKRWDEKRQISAAGLSGINAADDMPDAWATVRRTSNFSQPVDNRPKPQEFPKSKPHEKSKSLESSRTLAEVRRRLSA